MDPFIGEIRPLAFSWAPQDWALCNGALLPYAQFQALGAIIGTLYGGDGKTTIGLPNLQGRTPIGAGSGVGLTSRAVASNGGTMSVTLNAAQMPPHQHAVNAVVTGNAADLSNAPASNMTLSRTYNQWNYSTTDIDPWVITPGLDNSTIGVAGASATQGHPNMQPWLCISFCIATDGVWPERP